MSDNTRQRLAEALADLHPKLSEAIVARLAPFVDEIARERAAAELERQQSFADSEEGDGLIRPSDIRARAAALRVQR